MTKYTRRSAALLLVTAAVLAACSSESKKGPDSAALGADTTLNRDLAMANRDTTVQPALKDVPAPTPTPAPTTTRPQTRTPAPAPRTTPAPRPANPPQPTTKTTPSGNTVTTSPSGTSAAAAGGGAVGSIPAGATLTTHANSRICTNTNAVGDHVTATVENTVAGSNGAAIPAGATVNLTVTQLKRSENVNDPIVMEFAVNSVTFGGRTYPIEATATVEQSVVERIKDQPQAKDVQKVAIGAVAGAIAGKIIGKSTKGAVIGGAAGAAAGAATAAATANYQGCIPSGGNIVVKLTSAATVRA